MTSQVRVSKHDPSHAVHGWGEHPGVNDVFAQSHWYGALGGHSWVALHCATLPLEHLVPLTAAVNTRLATTAQRIPTTLGATARRLRQRRMALPRRTC